MSEYLTPVDYDTPAGRVLRNVEDHLADFHEDNGPLVALVSVAMVNPAGDPRVIIEAIRENWLHEYDRNPFPRLTDG
jgi:hypothetical protein